MNVKELKEMLEEYPDEMEVIHDMYSDYRLIRKSDFSVVKAVNKGSWIMRQHDTMSEVNKSNMKEYLHLVGN